MIFCAKKYFLRKKTFWAKFRILNRPKIIRGVKFYEVIWKLVFLIWNLYLVKTYLRNPIIRNLTKTRGFWKIVKNRSSDDSSRSSDFSISGFKVSRISFSSIWTPFVAAIWWNTFTASSSRPLRINQWGDSTNRNGYNIAIIGIWIRSERALPFYTKLCFTNCFTPNFLQNFKIGVKKENILV